MEKRNSIPLVFELAVALSAVMGICLLVALTSAAMAGRADFAMMFKAASLVWRGRASSIYSLSIFNHLAFEAAFLSPLAPLGLARAYAVFWILNAAVLFGAIRLLRLTGFQVAAAVCFAPVVTALLQGQDSIITLFLLAGAAGALGDDHELAAGLLAGLTIYKPQIGVPIFALMFLWRRWRFAAGFAASAAACVAASVAMIGFRRFVGYVKLLRTMDPKKYGIFEADMVGVRGFLSRLLSGRELFLATAAVSVAIALYVLVKGWGSSPREQFALAVLCCCLVSYHMLAHDLAIVLVPLADAWRVGTKDRWLWWTSLATYALPAALVPTRDHFLMTVPLLAFMLALARQTSARAQNESVEPEVPAMAG